MLTDGDCLARAYQGCVTTCTAGEQVCVIGSRDTARAVATFQLERVSTRVGTATVHLRLRGESCTGCIGRRDVARLLGRHDWWKECGAIVSSATVGTRGTSTDIKPV